MSKQENGHQRVVVEIIEILDIEEFSKGGGSDRPPKAKKYRIRIDKQKYDVESPTLSGQKILELAGKIPPERWMLNQKFRHGEFKPVGLDDIVDFTAPGVERFTTLPKDQTEGFAPRRQFALPEEDVAALDAASLQWETIVSGGNWVIIRAFELPDCFVDSKTSVAISIPSGYPTSPLDMAYFNPPIQRKDGRPIVNTQASEMIDGINWQRWSRHYTPSNPWKPGEYNTVTHLHLIRTWLEREASK